METLPTLALIVAERVVPMDRRLSSLTDISQRSGHVRRSAGLQQCCLELAWGVTNRVKEESYTGLEESDEAMRRPRAASAGCYCRWRGPKADSLPAADGQPHARRLGAAHLWIVSREGGEATPDEHARREADERRSLMEQRWCLRARLEAVPMPRCSSAAGGSLCC